MHRKMPVWFGGEPRGKGPVDQVPRRAAYPVEEPDEELSPPVLGQPRTKRVAEERELLVLC